MTEPNIIPSTVTEMDRLRYIEACKMAERFYEDSTLYRKNLFIEKEIFDRIPKIEQTLESHLEENNRHREEDRQERENRDVFYNTRWAEHEKRIDDKFAELHSLIIPIVKDAVTVAVTENIKPIREYLFGNGDDKSCVARRLGDLEKILEAIITDHKQRKQNNWVTPAMIITWAIVIVSTILNLLLK